MIDLDEPESPGPESTDRGRIIVAAVLFEAGLAPLALVLGWLLGQRPLEDFDWRGRDAALGIAAALPIYVLLLAAMRWPVGPFQTIKRFFDEVLRPLLGGRPTSDLALLAMAAGVGEEMLFRGVIQGSLARLLGSWGGLAAASFLFGLLHPITLAYIVIAAILGAYLGWLWLVSGNLLVPIVTHALYDFLALWTLLQEPEPTDRESD